jgi:hypothetical protein
VRQHVPQIKVHQGRVKQQAVQEVEDSADAWKKFARILHVRLALEKGFDQIPDHRGNCQNHAQDHGMGNRHAFEIGLHEERVCDTGAGGEHNGPGKAFPGFSRANPWNHFVFADHRCLALRPKFGDLG